MIVVGLTGSIGMGKTTANMAFASLGVRTWNADSEVHCLLSRGGAAVYPISKLFPKAFCDDPKGSYINRNILSKNIFQNAEALNVLEDILHPLVKKKTPTRDRIDEHLHPLPSAPAGTSIRTKRT